MDCKEKIDKRLARSVLIDFLKSNWFHSIRQPLTIISGVAGFLQLLNEGGTINHDILKNKLLSIEEQTEHTENLLNTLSMFYNFKESKCSAKLQEYLQKGFDIMGRDLECWELKYEIISENNILTKDPINATLILLVICKIFALKYQGPKKMLIRLSSNSSFSINEDITPNKLPECLDADQDEELICALNTIISSIPELLFRVKCLDNSMILSISPADFKT